MKKLLILFCVLFIITFAVINYVLFPLKYKSYITESATKYNLSASVVASVINAESNFNKNAVSHKGAIGLMQILPSTAEWINSQIYNTDFSKELLKNPQINIEMGCFYLNYLSKKFDNLTCVLCAYNAGETVVRQWLNNPEYSTDKQTLTKIPYSETNNYVKKIQNYIKVYSLKFN